jgi:hypothetical protein
MHANGSSSATGFATKQRVISGFACLVFTVLGFVAPSFADGTAPSNGRERFFLKRQNCPWTEEMGKYMYECVKKNDGFNAHWCHNEAIDAFCPVDENAVPHPAAVPPSDKPADTEVGKKG